MKISVTSYSFSRLTGSGKCSEIELVKLAKDIGFDGIEFAEIHTPDGMNKKEYAAQLNEECKRQGIECVSYTIGANFLCDDLNGEIERLKAEVDVCEALGARLMRHDAAWGYGEDKKHTCGFENALPTLIEGCRAVTQYAAAKGIKTMTENHGQFCQESTRVERLINGVNHPNFGALIDVGNFLCADENPALAVGRMAPYAFHVHFKDFHFKSGNEFLPPDGFFSTRGGNYLRGAIIGHGVVPVYQCLKILKNSGYDGYLTVEFEGMEDAVTGVTCGFNTLKKLIETV
ncbi:MAG: sugar phosphate isomerase/epimerase [Clostridia bacterium]|nr:sugar phosphate isomerase/epimerase [Clostridia bacterium]